MKILWMKYLLASIFVGLLAGVYQLWVHKDRSLSLSKFEQLQDQQIGNFGISELNRAARIAQQEQFAQNYDVDIPVTFEQYDNSVSYVPSVKASKDVQSYDPNAGLSIDRSSTPVFGQMPVEQSAQYPEFSSETPYNYSGYTPSSNASNIRDNKKTSKFKNEEPQTFSKIEYPQEDKPVIDKINQKDVSSKFANNNFQNQKKLPEPEPKALSKPKDIEEKPVDTIAFSSDDASTVIPSQPKTLWENFKKKFWDWWKNRKKYSDRSTVRMPEPNYESNSDFHLELNSELNPVDDNSKFSNGTFEKEKALLNPVDLKITSKPIINIVEATIEHKPKVIETGLLDLFVNNSKPSDQSAKTSTKLDEPKQTQDVEILEPEEQLKIPEPERVTEVEFIEPSTPQITKTDFDQISTGHEKLKNKFFKGSNFGIDPRFAHMRQAVPQIEASSTIHVESKKIVKAKEPKLKIRRLTPEEEIAREMEILALPNQGNPFVPLPYEQRTEADPIGQLYVIKSPSTGQEFVGTVEEIAEFLEQRPWWRKIADAFIKNRANSKDFNFEHSEGTAAEYEEPLTDEQRAEKAISDLFEGPNPPKTEDVTKSIISSSSAGPTTFSESVSRIASDLGSEVGVLAAGGSGATRLIP
ncbi:hypothetical protein KBB68_03655 [Candidatus Babeliales bacterium]|nr:hypothetical protein [Candidatus Babeliales bacterium]